MAGETFAVLGAGQMGSGIATLALIHGKTVLLYDPFPGALRDARARIEEALDDAERSGQIGREGARAVIGRLRLTDSIVQAVESASVVIEAVPEDTTLKRDVMSAAAQAAPAGSILASNTSSLSITEIAATCSHPERVLGMHFFNPPVSMPLVEVVWGEVTEEAAIERACSVAADLGKETIIVRDTPGFATSRLAIALANEAMRMVETGVATVEEIDRSARLGLRHSTGPLQMCDWLGLDVCLAVTEHLHRELGTETFRPPLILKRLVRGGHLGRKTGRGFYKYS